jgi:hypothetical protein
MNRAAIISSVPPGRCIRRFVSERPLVPLIVLCSIAALV